MRTLMLLAVLMLAACNTIAGVGQDLSGGARAVQGMTNSG
jgi:predicted small secreted protein